MTTTDVLVIGTGIGGLSAAIAAAEAGLSVLVISKAGDLRESNTYYAQGGIVETGNGDSPGLLEDDIVAAGGGINNRRAVSLLAEEGPSLVAEYLVEKAGVPFQRDSLGQLDRTREGAHSVRRIIHVKDSTGASIQAGLLEYAGSLSSIRIESERTAVDIITNTHNSDDSQERYRRPRALGAFVFDEKGGEIHPYFARAVVLATGGIGNIYLHTSNPSAASGDGVAMAYRLGCEIINAEYVQFHPTVLHHRDVDRFLITEALRGEGAILRTRKGEAFMERYEPEKRDLAPRDAVARAIYREMDRNGEAYVYLDATGIQGVDVRNRFPHIASTCDSIGIDVASKPIPVVPAAHYFNGGVKTDLHGRTSIRGLYAVGETACTGVHGANRLASVSLLEALVFGLRAGRNIAKHCRKSDSADSATRYRQVRPWVYPHREEDVDSLLVHHDLLHIRSIMWNYVGIIRSRKRLYRALADLNYMSHRIERFYREARVRREIIELRNAVLTAILVARSALANTKSLGGHYIDEAETS